MKIGHSVDVCSMTSQWNMPPTWCQPGEAHGLILRPAYVVQRNCCCYSFYPTLLSETIWESDADDDSAAETVVCEECSVVAEADERSISAQYAVEPDLASNSAAAAARVVVVVEAVAVHSVDAVFAVAVVI